MEWWWGGYDLIYGFADLSEAKENGQKLKNIYEYENKKRMRMATNWRCREEKKYNGGRERNRRNPGTGKYRE